MTNVPKSLPTKQTTTRCKRPVHHHLPHRWICKRRKNIEYLEPSISTVVCLVSKHFQTIES
ncbi:hypothetical protein Bhyg_00861 [Pseudolycoriella hygida]|uniref:Uncharacterized protein n=1 Tax=Pseudolycoriella hygida TaxID=35572 RepID=A0A9Q0S5B9_9DIPT|nr:hypothetical protein Bhyg_00861 [Pseudolycoriella hygida]